MPLLAKPVLILVSCRYNSREFWPALRILRAAGIPVDIRSTHPVICPETNTARVNRVTLIPPLLLPGEDKKYSGMLVISGNPKDTEKYYDHPYAQGMVRLLNEQGKPLGAICAAVPALGPAVRGKKVSWFPLQKSRNILEMAGAILQEVGLTVDQNVVTAENEWLTPQWAELFRDLVLGKEARAPRLIPSGHHPKRIPRRFDPITGRDTLCDKDSDANTTK